MKRLVKRSRVNPDIIQLAREIVSHIQAKDFAGEVSAIREWTARNVRYTRDVYDTETIQPAEHTINVGHGDCDDQAIVVATLLNAIGAKARFIAIAQNPRYFCHVYAETQIGQNWYPVETTEPVNIGWQPANVVRKMTVHI